MAGRDKPKRETRKKKSAGKKLVATVSKEGRARIAPPPIDPLADPKETPEDPKARPK